eukprot:CAMPEP_0183577012 /NCGR_PEP_ID=MMETSP0371-20130417/138952_1 /TAXON_ID=268820 /ORGANISM="Peridinium aciculiferum, Strain PAER-2" /LENGTH=48 /DNA_ID= /DNA_START= /DNA_END= /DNA_ORIENTATION=
MTCSGLLAFPRLQILPPLATSRTCDWGRRATPELQGEDEPLAHFPMCV